jgi:hypothetical protein
MILIIYIIINIFIIIFNIMAGERPSKLFEKRDQRGAFKSTTAPAADVSNYLSGNIDSSSSLGDSSHLYDE